MSSNHIYPYVYRLTHRETGQFYIGYRCANRAPAEEDIGIHYFTSSDVIKKIGFENFDFVIVAVFFDKADAHSFEYKLIHENLKDPLNLNRSASPRNPGHTEETRGKIKFALTGKLKSDEHKKHLSESRMGMKMPLRSSDHCIAISVAATGKKRPWASAQAAINAENAIGVKRSPETKAKMRAAWERRKLNR